MEVSRTPAESPSEPRPRTAAERRSTTSRAHDTFAPRGFTLVEMLVVITIIGILAALVTVGVQKALEFSKQTRIKLEVDNLDLAFKSYKEKYGSYPPCDLRFDSTVTDPAMPLYNAPLRAHIARAFPRYNMANLGTDLATIGVDTVNFRPDQALVFWLRGFSPNPTNPFDTAGVKTPFFEFDKTRLLQLQASGAPGSANIASYFPSGVTVSTDTTFNPPKWTSGGAPFVYFDSQTYGKLPTMTVVAQPFAFNATVPSMPLPNTATTPIFTGAGPVVPYWNDVNANLKTNDTADLNSNETWANPDSFQIICTGLDGKYGAELATAVIPAARLYPTGKDYDIAGADDDNITNFSVKARIGDAKP